MFHLLLAIIIALCLFVIILSSFRLIPVIYYLMKHHRMKSSYKRAKKIFGEDIKYLFPNQLKRS